MADHNRQNDPERTLGTEMDVLKDKNCSIRQIVTFPGGARRLNTNNEKSNAEVEGKDNILAIHEVKGTRNAIDIRNAICDLQINRSFSTNASEQCTEKKEWNKLFYRNVLETDDGLENSHDVEASADGGCFLEKRELQFKHHLEPSKQLPSPRGESTQVFQRGDFDTEVVNEGSEHDIEAAGDKSYFRANYDLQFGRLSELDARRRPTKPGYTEAFVHTSNCKTNRETKQQVTHGEDDEYWRRMLRTKDEITPDKLPIKREVFEAKHQWYRSKEKRPKYFRSTPSKVLEFWFITLALIMSIITITFIFFLWKYLLSVSS